MGETENQNFYTELAPWWPLISPAAEYTEEAAFCARLLRRAGREVVEVLELGSGGGSNAAHLKHEFTMTLTDLSQDMLEVSAELNPECEHLVGDMRTLRLGRTFDAVFVHDAVVYMVTEDDLLAAIVTAFEHCRPGGVALFVPDAVSEIYQPGSDMGGVDHPDGSGVRYLAWSLPQALGASTVVTEYAFLLRDADGTVRSERETHETGVFDTQIWLDVLEAAGFRPEVVPEQTSENRVPRVLFLGHRPV